jgi:hypothetical protein
MEKAMPLRASAYWKYRFLLGFWINKEKNEIPHLYKFDFMGFPLH